MERIRALETRLDDVQALGRAIAGRQRDLRLARVILFEADTRHNREVVRSVEELRPTLPGRHASLPGRLARGRDPGGAARVIL